MNHEAILKKRLCTFIDEINSELGYQKITFNEQNVKKGNISLSGANGRLYVQPKQGVYYDVSLSGQSLEKELTKKIRELFDGKPYGYKQTKPNTTQPYWRTENFSLVKKAIRLYVKTEK